MPQPCRQYSSEQISQFVDNELPAELAHSVQDHLVHCAECRQLVSQYQALSGQFARHVVQHVEKMNEDQLKRSADIVFDPDPKGSLNFISRYTGKNIFLKLACIVAIVVISLVGFQGHWIAPAGPSAIVKSVNTDFNSVMIIETEQNKHTIIWFSET
jgi:anti-sigma factor RsiW